MKELDYIYVLAGRGTQLRGAIPVEFRILKPSDNIVFANSIADCLNAERSGAEAVIWNSEDYDQLQELSPNKSEYGWMIVSINIPILFNITDVAQLEELKDVTVQGFYSEELGLLKESRKKMETLFRE